VDVFDKAPHVAGRPHFGFTRHGLPVYARIGDHHKDATAYQRFNKRVALALTAGVGTMTTFWLFCLLALCSLPSVLSAFAPFAHAFPAWAVKVSIIALVAWIAQTMIQLVLLPALMVGQNLQNVAADARSAKTFEDVETVKADLITTLDRLDVRTEGGIAEVMAELKAVRALLAATPPPAPAKRLATPAEYVDKRAAGTTLSVPRLPEQPKRLMTFTDKIRAADGDTVRGEAAFLLACNARDADDWRLLADALDLSGAAPDWDIARCCRVTLTVIRPGEAFSANRLRQAFPRRAWPLISGALKALALYGFIASTQQTERSTAPGSRGWRVAVYRLTRAGEGLREEFVPAVRADDIMWPPEARFGEGVPGSARRLQKVS
jgi:hypothetical protein